MSIERFPVGQKMDVAYPTFEVSLTLHSTTQMTLEINEGSFARTEAVEIGVTSISNGIFVLNWQEKDGATVTNIQDYDRGVVHSFVTMPDGQFIRMSGPILVTQATNRIEDDRSERNNSLVIEAMIALFQWHDASVVERLYAPGYVQHHPSIPQGRDALRALVAALSPDVYHEPGLVVAEGDYVAIHGRIRGWAPSPQVVVDLFRIENGKLAEHWDVLQDELQAPIGGLSMFDPEERTHQAQQSAA